MDGFLCQDLEAKLFKWFTSRLDASKIKKESDMRLFNADGLEVCVGDVVRYGGKPCYVESIGESISITTMDERKMFLRVLPYQIGCILERGCARCISPV